MGFLVGLIEWGPVAVTVASALAALTPTAKDDAALKWVRRFIEVMALDVLHARPAAPKPPELAPMPKDRAARRRAARRSRK